MKLKTWTINLGRYKNILKEGRVYWSKLEKEKNA